jgi:ATP/ADP translocase
MAFGKARSWHYAIMDNTGTSKVMFICVCCIFLLFFVLFAVCCHSNESDAAVDSDIAAAVFIPHSSQFLIPLPHKKGE